LPRFLGIEEATETVRWSVGVIGLLALPPSLWKRERAEDCARRRLVDRTRVGRPSFFSGLLGVDSVGRSWIWVLVAAACLNAVCPARGFGQAARPPRDAVATLKADDTVWVTTLDGRTTEGRFCASRDSIFEWEAPTGRVRTPLADIERIEARDPIRDGIRRGALAGGVAGGLFGASLGLGLSCKTNCGAGYSRAKDIGGAIVAGGVLGAGEGAALGAILDATIHRRRLVYAKPGTPGVTFTPLIGMSRRGVAATVRW
jgi:hypothetical protein